LEANPYVPHDQKQKNHAGDKKPFPKKGKTDADVNPIAAYSNCQEKIISRR